MGQRSHRAAAQAECEGSDPESGACPLSAPRGTLPDTDQKVPPPKQQRPSGPGKGPRASAPLHSNFLVEPAKRLDDLVEDAAAN